MKGLKSLDVTILFAAMAAISSPCGGAAIYSAAEFLDTISFRIPAGSGHAFSADGQRILLSSDESGVFNVYTVDAASGTRNQLTASADNATFAVSYFPNDDRLLFTADDGGDERDHVWVRELDGATRNLTPGPKSRAWLLGWSRDGDRFYLATNERDQKMFDVYEYASRGYGRKLIFRNDSALTLSAISGSGRWVALLDQRTSADSDVYVADTLAEAQPRLITRHDGDVALGVFGFTRDDSALIISTDEHGEWLRAVRHSLGNGAVTAYEQAGWDIAWVQESRAGRYRCVGINADGSTLISVSDTRGFKKHSLPGVPSGTLSKPQFSPDDRFMAFLVEGDSNPGDLFVLDIAAGTTRQLTHALSRRIAHADLVAGEAIRYRSSDGVSIPGYLFKPQDASALRPVPALVWVHGGPREQMSREYNATIQYLVNHGYAVVAPNYRGSTGYGKKFSHMDDRRHGEGDLQDVVRARDYLKSLNWVDGGRVGVIEPFGGYMVAAALAFEPNAFDAGIDVFGVTNWERTLKSMPPGGGPIDVCCTTRWETRSRTRTGCGASHPSCTRTGFVSL